VPELGATHTVIFGGFSAEALKDRLIDAQAKVVVTADGGWRRMRLYLKQQVDLALVGNGVVQNVLVVRHGTANMEPGRDRWWHELQADVSADCPAEPMDSEDMLFILYTSGTTEA